MDAAQHLARDEAGAFERLDVLRRCRERHVEGFRELAHGPLSVGQLAQHPAARGIAECVKDSVELSGIMFNHVVEYMGAPRDCQPLS